MLKVIAVNVVKEECAEQYLAIAKELVEKTNKFDKGCIKYELCKDIGDPLRFVMLEEWEDKGSLDAHFNAPHFVELIPKLGDCTQGPAEITLLEKAF